MAAPRTRAPGPLHACAYFRRTVCRRNFSLHGLASGGAHLPTPTSQRELTVRTCSQADASRAAGAEEAPDIQWNVVSLMYAAGCTLWALFGLMQMAGKESVAGIWIIFCPFLPCLLYALYRWYCQRDRAKPKQD